jgi:hypothetical protein
MFVASSDIMLGPRAYRSGEWKARTMESFDTYSVSSWQATEDVELESSNATIFTHETRTVTTPTTNLPTPLSGSFGFSYGSSTISAPFWGRQAQPKRDPRFDYEPQSEFQSDLSGDALFQGLSIDADDDDGDAEFVEELESVYSAFADLSPSGEVMRLSTVFGMDDVMSDTESVTDPHLHSISICTPLPRAWTDSA